MISFIFICFIIAIVVVLGVSSIRKEYVTKPVFKFFKRVLPPITDTEREAMEAGDVWWDGALFSGNPNWQKLLAYSKPELTNDEQAFLDNQVETLLGMLDDYQILQHDKDLPKNVWDYLKSEGFFALIIPKKYGGKEFSAYANSTIVSKIASRSNTAAITVMVPNSLGPGELLSHYGTEEQRQYWLPRLSNGEDIPCFALTGPEAGSDAGSIPDTGVICKGKFEGKTVVGIKLNWSKRYITLAPVATVLGLAFKLYDPDGLIGDTKSIGITCALIPTNHKGVVTGQRHNPLNMAFMNGTTQGKDVFVPLDWIIGGEAYAGKGWRMLVECLSAGRGISLPALSTASGHVCAKMTSAYATVRQQFGLSIAKFEGIQQAMARIGGTNYALEAMRRFTVSAIDLGMSPSVITAIAKYHMTEFSREVVNDAMDIHAGKGIQLGPKNYLGSAYMGLPVAITVEGANILTRNLMIFGQGATRCHPYVLQEMTTVAMEDQDEALKQFDELLVGHAIFATTNGFCALFQGLTASIFNGKPRSGPTARYYQHLSRMSRGFALCSDFAMMVLGGDLKRKEMLSARLGDVLSQLCIASAVLKHYEDQGRQVADLPYVDFCVQRCLYEIGQAFNGVFDNFPNRPIAWTMKLLVFPLGNHFKYPTDTTLQQICELMTEPGVNRDRHTHLCYIGDGEDDVTGVVERAFVMAHKVKDTRKQLLQAQRDGDFDEALTYSELITAANNADIINKDQAEQLNYAEELRLKTINVDAFDKLG